MVLGICKERALEIGERIGMPAQCDPETTGKLTWRIETQPEEATGARAH